MQTPTMKTPIAKCLDLSTYLIVILGRFPQNQALAALVPKAQAAADKLDDAQNQYLGAVKAILPARALLRFCDVMSDRRISQTQKRADIAGKAVLGHVFPDGSAAITRLQGQSQVDAMILLEGRLAPLATSWPEAASEQQAIAQHRAEYDTAVKARTKLVQDAAALRAARNVAKQEFLTVYEEVQGRIIAEFPRDTVMQELFFDDVRTRSTAAEADDAGAEPAEPAAPQTPPAPPAPTPA